jgi:hypothetical protein
MVGPRGHRAFLEASRPRNKTLTYNPDGSLTLYVQTDPPPAAQRDNWLPAPKGDDMSLYRRAYWPKTAVTDGSWTPPPVGVRQPIPERAGPGKRSSPDPELQSSREKEESRRRSDVRG